MKIIGITGRSGCGKSSVTKLFFSKGYPCIDADLVAREVLEPGSGCIKQLQNAFGSDIVDGSGTLQRRLLADRAFATPEGTAKLTSITHPEILRRIDMRLQQAASSGAKLVFVDGAVIVGTPFATRCNFLVVVTAPYEQSVSRICSRDGIAPAMARRRLDAQTPESVLREAADFVVENDSTSEILEKRALTLLHRLEQDS